MHYDMNKPVLPPLLLAEEISRGKRDIFSNPLLHIWQRYNLKNIYLTSYARCSLTSAFAWAIPSVEALDAIKALNMPVLEVGAGTGYWAALLTNRGVKVRAYDISIVGKDINTYHRHDFRYAPIRYPSAAMWKRYRDHALMLCWPPYDGPMAYNALIEYKGDHLIYVGEGMHGCTADDQFHHALNTKWAGVESIDIPRFGGLHDRLYIYQRRRD